MDFTPKLVSPQKRKKTNKKTGCVFCMKGPAWTLYWFIFICVNFKDFSS